MLAAAATRARNAFHEELRLDRIEDFPPLAACLRLWQETAPEDRVPARLDPLDLPRQVLPHVMLLDLERSPPCLRIRLAGTAICQRYGCELRGMTPDDVLDSETARLANEIVLDVAATGRPNLARRFYFSADDRLWSYTRLILPLSRFGRSVDSFFSASDPASFRQIA